jgi:parvulin-like peptidyl-prolyl isomerase
MTDDSAATDALVAQIGDAKITKEDFDNRYKRFTRGKTDPDSLLMALIRVREFGTVVLPDIARSKGLEKTDSYKFSSHQKEIQTVSDAYLQSLYDKELKMTDEVLEEYYKDNIDRYTIPRKYKTRQIALKIADDVNSLSPEEKAKKIKDLTDELNMLRAEIKNADDFAKVASDNSDDNATRTKGGDLGYIAEQYKNGFDGRLPKMKPGDISEPFVNGNSVYVIMVEDIQEPEVQSFDKVKDQVTQMWRNENQKKLRNELADKLLKSADYKFVYKPSDLTE